MKKKRRKSRTTAPVARALYTIGVTTDPGDQLWAAAGWRFDRELAEAGSVAELAKAWDVTPRQAQRIVVLYRGPQR